MGLCAANQAVQDARFAGACEDQHADRPAPSLGWPGERKSIGAPGPTNFFPRSEKFPGGRQAKGWETAETAAAEVGVWREARTGYPPYPPPPGPPPPVSRL